MIHVLDSLNKIRLVINDKLGFAVKKLVLYQALDLPLDRVRVKHLVKQRDIMIAIQS